MIAQKARMEPAYLVEQEAREARRSGRTLGKHAMSTDMIAETSADGAKRAKLEIQPAVSGLGIGKGPVIDVTGLGLPLQTVIELVISNLEVVSAEILDRAFTVSQRGRLFWTWLIHRTLEKLSWTRLQMRSPYWPDP